MNYRIDAACLSNRGLIRSNNEDNFFFNGRCMEVENKGLHNPVTMQTDSKEVLLAVFDGMGGESYGEYAAFAAASHVNEKLGKLKNYYVREKQFLDELITSLNVSVLEKGRELGASGMGTTIAALYISHNFAYVCNVGDSRVYRLRQGIFQQLSEDHIDRRTGGGKKPPLTQCLGIDPDDFLIEPYIAKGELSEGDKFLLCSDGLTDMLTNIEIAEILMSNDDPAICVDALVAGALANGGKDNITVIVCRIEK